MGHGRCYTPEYRAWQDMRQRCHNPRAQGYAHYHGRGIEVYEGWRGPDGFEAFLAHIGLRPSSRHSLDRIDNDGNYEPGNVRWATPEEQQRNTSHRKRITWRGESLMAAEWAERIGIPGTMIFRRIWSGWSVDDALTVPPQMVGGAVTRGRNN